MSADGFNVTLAAFQDIDQFVSYPDEQSKKEGLSKPSLLFRPAFLDNGVQRKDKAGPEIGCKCWSEYNSLRLHYVLRHCSFHD